MNPTNNAASHSSHNARSLVFVVDDEPLLLELASTLLESAGYAVRTFRKPETAVEVYRKANPRPGLIITDYAMHNMTGLDLIRECRDISARQKIILVSGTVDESVYANSDVKPNRFLSKPYHAKELISLVQSVLAS